MFSKESTWGARIGVLLVWLLVTAGIAFGVARVAANDESTTDVTAPLPPIAQDQRPTVSLGQETITQIVSAAATVTKSGDDWLLVAPVPSSDLAYKLLDPPLAVRALIDGGPAGFPCAWVGLGQPSGGAPARSARDVAPETVGVTMQCKIPANIRVVAGMTGKMLLQMSKPATVEALPITAVVGSEGQGQVVVVKDDGTTELKTVQLGISDIYNIEIKSGLDPKEKVLVVPTQADFDRAKRAS